MRNFRLISLSVLVLGLVGIGSGLILYFYLASDLPEIFSIEDYEPRLVSDVYARGGEKIGEFYDEQNRKLVPVDEIPELLREAFMAAEDSGFYTHNGFNFQGILRAIFMNVVTGKKVQGASTITQQTARTLFLSSEKTYTRKLKEAILARRMEHNLEKNDILYLYLNQVYFGQGAYGVASAAETYFRKKVKDLTLSEMSLIAGLLTAPSRYNPVNNPSQAKTRQLYVLKRMLETGRITQDQYDVATNETLVVYRKKKYKEVAPYFVETIRQLLVKELGQDQVLSKGLQIYSSLDFEAQKKAQESVRRGLRDLDKRQGYRGAKGTLDISDETALIEYLTKIRNEKINQNIATFEIFPDSTTNKYDEFKLFQEKDDNGKVVSNIPAYLKIDEVVEGVVVDIDEKNNLAFIRFAESQGIIPIENMDWVRTRDLSKRYGDHLHIKKVKDALKIGDLIDVGLRAKTAKKMSLKERKGFKADLSEYAELALEQEPGAEAALLSFDLKTEDITAMVGGRHWRQTKLNRTYQAHRQTGSSFKPIVYAAALERGLTPATPIMGAPIVYNQEKESDDENKKAEKIAARQDKENSDEEETKVWKPGNYGGRFTGDILLRNALKRSLNTPTIRVLEKAGVNFVADYAKRLGIFSTLNMDMSLALGTSGITLYEMTKVFSVFARMGKKIRPIIIHEVKNHQGEELLQSISFDIRFADQAKPIEEEFEQKRERHEQEMMSMAKAQSEEEGEEKGEEDRVSPYFFNNPDQLISPQTSFLITSILQAAVNEPGGTGAKARALGREVAGKTGTTNGYYDAWFMGYTPQLTTGVWVGFDREQTLGKGESGGRAALPIWVDYMKEAVKDHPKENFPIPNEIVFANIDNETGRLASSSSHEVVRQAFRNGTEPGQKTEEAVKKEEEEEKTNFYREDF